MKVKLNNASFSYDKDTRVFDSLSLSTDENEVFCILGPNGSGKTTLLKCIGGMLNLDSGDYFLGKKNVNLLKRREIAQNVGYVPQEHSSVFPYTVLEVVLMGRAPHLDMFSSPSGEDFEIAKNAIERVGISHLEDKPYTEISGGERQLVLIARVLAQKPKIMLLDEPTSHLDFRNQSLVLRMLNDFAEQGLSIIMTSHFPNHALLYSSRVALMKEGGFISVGSPENVVTEENLRRAYEVNCRICSVKDSEDGDSLRICVPDARGPRSINPQS